MWILLQTQLSPGTQCIAVAELLLHVLVGVLSVAEILAEVLHVLLRILGVVKVLIKKWRPAS